MQLKRLVVPLFVALFLMVGVAACSDDDDDGGGGGNENAAAETSENGSPASGRDVKIAFSAPGADHGWMAAITENAREEAENLGDVELIASEGVTESAAQADQIETLIQQKPDVLVVLPFEGEALTPVAQKAMHRASRS
jgi:ribose transport system substrate-binding protein